VIVDLHTHTRASHDGFTSPAELLDACRTRGVGAIAITEHDRPSQLDPAPFREAGIEVVPGCEFTTDRGAHILGLFVRGSIPAGLPAGRILDFIAEQRGIAVMPHPFKPCSGYLALHGEDEHVGRFAFVELINGGWKSGDHAARIVDFARRHGIRMIASSDSHRACQVALCCTRIPDPPAGGSFKESLLSTEQRAIELLLDGGRLRTRGRRTRGFQRTGAYQAVLRLLPHQLRRIGKLAQYRWSADRRASAPSFEIVLPESTQW